MTTITNPKGTVRAISSDGRLLDQHGWPILTRRPKGQAAPLRSRSDPVKERFVDTADGFQVVTEQLCDDTIDAVHSAGSMFKRNTKGARYLGSAPILVAQIWAKQCGAQPGTREFTEFAHKQLTSGEYSKFKVQMGG